MLTETDGTGRGDSTGTASASAVANVPPIQTAGPSPKATMAPKNIAGPRLMTPPPTRDLQQRMYRAPRSAKHFSVIYACDAHRVSSV
ncbi:hypothetical protein JCM9534A_28050 [Catenuloplanes indicus JCM 9534]